LRPSLWWLAAALVALAACTRPAPQPTDQPITPAPHILATVAHPSPQTTLIVPTPDSSRTPAPQATEIYLIQSGDTLGRIALEYGATVEDLMAQNGLTDADDLQVGQPIVVPIQVDRVGPAFKIVPDSELVYGPAYTHFDVAAYVAGQSGYLKSYSELVEGQTLAGAQIVQLVAQRYSVGPRVLLALIEYQAGWVTRAALDAQSIAYPAGYVEASHQGLYRQLTWAADYLNDGYYGLKDRGYSTLRFGDGTRARIAPGLNAGTVGVQEALGLTLGFDAWQNAAGPQGFYATYVALFGDPFAYAVEPLIPPTLTQPEMRLPWAEGDTWYYTGGPHGGWGSGSAWAALDFTPPGDQLGCYDSDAWVTAVAAGVVVRSGDGAVVVDMDGDGFDQTGWTVLYMHIATTDRVAVGTQLAVGDPVGHPSCEGGYSNGTHVHIARRFNGQWMAAAGSIPLVLSGWRAQETLTEYDGTLINGNVVAEACECREAKNGLVSRKGE
jgi:LasA protease